MKAVAIGLAALGLASQWNMETIHAPEASVRSTGAGVKVAVLDSGVNLAHPDLAPNLWHNPGEAGREHNGVDDDHNGYVDDWQGWDFVQQDNDPTDTNGHGSHIAGIVAARGGDGIGVAGVAGRATIMPVRVLGNTNLGLCDDTAAAEAYAVEAGARVVNVSIGSPTPCPPERDVIEHAPNTLFVVSAGNDGQNLEGAPQYPCSYALPNVVCVASTDDRDRLSGFSNYGAASVDLAAPGEEILSTILRWGPEESILTDDFEAPLGGRWTTAGDPGVWQRSPFDQHGGTWSLVGAATGNGDARLPVDLAGRRDCAARVWIRRALDATGDARLWIETLPDGHTVDRRRMRLIGPGAYEEVLVDLAMLEGHANGALQFRIQTSTANPARFVAIDDLEVFCVPQLLDGYTGAPDEYFKLTGTSYAAPHVAGVAALVFAQHPTWTAAQVRQRILDTADRLPGLAGKTVSGGRLNALRAVGGAPPPVSRPPVPALTADPRVRLRRGAIVVGGLAVNAPGRLSVKIRARRLVASGARTVSAGRWAVRARLTRFGRGKLRRGRRVKGTLVVRFTPAAGAAIERTAKVIVRR